MPPVTSKKVAPSGKHVVVNKKDAKYFEKHEVRFGLAVRPEQYPGGEADVVEACNGSGVLVEEVVAAVHKTGDSVIHLDMRRIGMDIFDRAAGGASGTHATAAQLKQALDSDEALVAKVRLTEAESLTSLIGESEGVVLDFIKEEAAQNDEDKAEGRVSREDWNAFFQEIRRERNQYYLALALVRMRCFYGLGLTPGGETSLVLNHLQIPIVNASKRGQCSFGPCFWRTLFFRGFWSDFAYYFANNHPIGVMFYPDPVHPYDEMERRADFAAAFFTSFFGAGIMLFSQQGDDTDPVTLVLLSAIFVTIPSTIIKKICYLLFAQPCLLIDRSKSSGSCECCVDCCSEMFSKCGFAVVGVWCLMFCILGIIFWVSATAGDLVYWFYGLTQYWVLWFFIKLGIEFWPFKLGLRVLFLLRALTCGMVPFGQWHKEREEVLAVMREKIAARGRYHFTCPGSPREAENDGQHESLATSPPAAAPPAAEEKGAVVTSPVIVEQVVEDIESGRSEPEAQPEAKPEAQVEAQPDPEAP